MGPNTRTTEWSLADDDLETAMGPATTHEFEGGAADVQLDDPDHPPEIAISKGFEETHGKTDYRQVKPNKVYIGGLPDTTRPEDLRSCFGKLGNIVTVELKLGYGFVEFDSKEAAQESVARYHEGYFMGNKIKVELSHSRGRTYKRLEDPGACYACGESGHWARDCARSTHTNSRTEQSSRDRDYSSRDHHHQSRDTHSYRDDYSKNTTSRDTRYHDTPATAPTSSRDHRRALTPPRERRDDLPQRREYNGFRTRSSPPPAPPVSRHERSAHHHTSERDYSAGGPTSHRNNTYDRYERRHNNTDDRNAQYSSHSRRARTPPGPPPAREDYEKPSRSHYQAQDPHKRPATPPPPYPGNNTNGSRTRRRSLSPPARYDSRYGNPSQSDGDRYSAAPREGTRVRDYHHRSGRGEDSGYRRS